HRPPNRRAMSATSTAGSLPFLDPVPGIVSLLSVRMYSLHVKTSRKIPCFPPPFNSTTSGETTSPGRDPRDDCYAEPRREFTPVGKQRRAGPIGGPARENVRRRLPQIATRNPMLPKNRPPFSSS